MEILIIMILTVLVVYFSTLYFIQKKNIKETINQLHYINEHPDINLRLKIAVSNKKMEQLLAVMNGFLELYQQAQIYHKAEEKKLKQEIANISHDLRTPLTSILGYMNILNNEDLKEEEKKEYLMIVRKKGEVMKTLVESFYELSSVEAKDYVFQKED